MTNPTFSIPFAIFTPYIKDDIHARLKDNKRLACEIVHAIWKKNQTQDEKAAASAVALNGIGFNMVDAKFASNLAEQIETKGWQRMSGKQTRFIFRFAHRYAQQAADMLNSTVIGGGVIEETKTVKTIIRRRK